MKILIGSRLYSPSIGGIETHTEMLSREFVALGHEVRIVTRTIGASGKNEEVEVVRSPSAKKLFSLVQWCDVFMQQQVSLRDAWPLLMTRKKWVVVHHSWLRNGRESRTINDLVKIFLLRAASNIAVSMAIAEDIKGLKAQVIQNPYDEKLFLKYENNLIRTRRILFVGRLIPEKGLDVILNALSLLRSNGVVVDCTVVGDGPEKNSLLNQAKHLGLDSQICWMGAVERNRVPDLMRKHSILVVPSRWNEPFGIVVLEGLASGCRVVASDRRGIREAGGQFVYYVESDTAESWAKALLQEHEQHSINRNSELHSYLSARYSSSVALKYESAFMHL